MTTLISQVALYLPIALGIRDIVLTGTDLSAGRVVGLTAAVSAVLLQKVDLSRRLLTWFPDMPSGPEPGHRHSGGHGGGRYHWPRRNGFLWPSSSSIPFIVTLATQLITYTLILLLFMSNGNRPNPPLSGLKDGYKSLSPAP